MEIAEAPAPTMGQWRRYVEFRIREAASTITRLTQDIADGAREYVRDTEKLWKRINEQSALLSQNASTITRLEQERDAAKSAAEFWHDDLCKTNDDRATLRSRIEVLEGALREADSLLEEATGWMMGDAPLRKKVFAYRLSQTPNPQTGPRLKSLCWHPVGTIACIRLLGHDGAHQGAIPQTPSPQTNFPVEEVTQPKGEAAQTPNPQTGEK